MLINNRNKFRLTRFILLRISLIFNFFSKFRKPQKRLLVVKTDAIGDYILFRNYLKIIACSEKFQGYSVDLVGNLAWKEIALKYDKPHLRETWFINETTIVNHPSHILKLALSLFRNRYEYVLQPTYSRTLIGNGISALASGRYNIAYRSSKEHHPKYKKKTDKFYTQLIPLEDDTAHEIEKNHLFFKTVLNLPSLPIVEPHFDIVKRQSNRIVIFPGSSDTRRNWEISKFASIISKLADNPEFEIILAGGINERPLSETLQKLLHNDPKVLNQAGVLGLPEFIDLVADSLLVISNETSAAHIAAACRTPCITIVGGGHFERFTPYPKCFSNKPHCVYKKMECYNCNWNCQYELAKDDIFPCISKIEVEDVWTKVQHLLLNNRE